jgi:hypothetical protein
MRYNDHYACYSPNAAQQQTKNRWGVSTAGSPGLWTKGRTRKKRRRKRRRKKRRRKKNHPNKNNRYTSLSLGFLKSKNKKKSQKTKQNKTKLKKKKKKKIKKEKKRKHWNNISKSIVHNWSNPNRPTGSSLSSGVCLSLSHLNNNQ